MDSWRTVLFALITEFDQTEIAFAWSANVRDELLNSESSDLYLFIIPLEFEIPLEACINIESSDRFCRKYVVRPNETFEELLNRSFLSKPKASATIDSIVDPLISALTKTGSDISSFDDAKQAFWKTSMLSEEGGLELAELLFTYNLDKVEE